MPTTISGNDGVSQVQNNTITQADLTTAILPLGVGQTWVNALGIRSANTPYVNDTSRPILVTVATQANNTTNSGALNVDGVNTSVQGLGNGLSNSQTTVVPAGSTYRLNTVNQVITLWSELR